MAEYGKDLEDAVCGDTSGMFQRVLVSLMTVSPEPLLALANVNVLIAQFYITKKCILEIENEIGWKVKVK